MNLSAPSQVIFLVSLVIAIVGLLIFLNVIALAIPSFWVMTVAYLVLAIGCLVRGA